MEDIPTTSGEGGFVAKLTNVKLLQQIFKYINLNDEASFYVKKDGLKMTVEAAKTFQANAFIQRNIFSDFQIAEEDDYGFNVSLTTLLECLSIFGSSTAGSSSGSSTLNSQLSTLAPSGSVISIGSAVTTLVLHYGRFGDPLSMWMEEDGLVSKAELPTQEIQETLYFDFSKPKISAKVVMLCENLRDIFAEFDMTSDTLEVAVDKDEKTLSFSTFGTAGEVTISLPDNSEMVHFFECAAKTKAKYPMNLIKNALKAVFMADKLSLRMDYQSILCLQYMMSFPEGLCFLEFYCAPEIDDCYNEV